MTNRIWSEENYHASKPTPAASAVVQEVPPSIWTSKKVQLRLDRILHIEGGSADNSAYATVDYSFLSVHDDTPIQWVHIPAGDVDSLISAWKAWMTYASKQRVLF